ncbi:arylesterase [Phaeobacter sp. HS012]|uniref:arylesterase n=1 Tax=unclassified Phaeobacter TaxID=2621772 RepID=UPI001B375296|nr:MULTISPECIES: arylesterase [unclassified Phaeobacter]MBQ4809234.1 arylesterase [Phaeobacter sp. HS012]MBQ4884060.1 arylesterase [Phaeobacter sp. HS011]
MRKMIAGLIFILTAAIAQAEPVRIAALGDSLVQGYGLPQGQGWVPQLQRWLGEKGAEVRLINAGVSGDTTVGGAARIDWTLADGPDALIVALGGNDLLRGLAPSESRANLTRILEVAQANAVPVLLVGIQAPGNYGADFKAEFDAIFPDLARDYDTLLHADSLAGIRAATGDDIQAAGKYLQEDGIHPNAEGVALNVAAIGPKVLELIELAKQ